MIILNPQWQGIGRRNPVPQGAQTIKNILSNFQIQEIPCDETDIAIEQNVKGLHQIADLTDRVNTLLDQHRPQKIFTCGGDCSSDYAQISHLNDLYDGDFAILWMDAHADLNTPKSSPSKNFHGMTLRCLTGDGADVMTQKIRKALKPEQITFSGLRSIDPEETRYLAAENITQYSVERTANGDLKAHKFLSKNLYLHVDIDCLDQSVFDDCATPTSGGFQLETVIDNLRFLNENYNIIGGCLTEYGPKTPGASKDIVQSLLLEGFQIKTMDFENGKQPATVEA